MARRSHKGSSPGQPIAVTGAHCAESPAATDVGQERIAFARLGGYRNVRHMAASPGENKQQAKGRSLRRSNAWFRIFSLWQRCLSCAGEQREAKRWRVRISPYMCSSWFTQPASIAGCFWFGFSILASCISNRDDADGVPYIIASRIYWCASRRFQTGPDFLPLLHGVTGPDMLKRVESDSSSVKRRMAVNAA